MEQVAAAMTSSQHARKFVGCNPCMGSGAVTHRTLGPGN